jgi:hypothetical protein
VRCLLLWCAVAVQVFSRAHVVLLTLSHNTLTKRTASWHTCEERTTAQSRVPAAAAMAVRVTALATLLAGVCAVNPFHPWVGLAGRGAAPLALWRSAITGGLLLAFLWYTGAASVPVRLVSRYGVSCAASFLCG